MFKEISKKAIAKNLEKDDLIDLKPCSSAVLAAQIKRIIPAKNFNNRKSSITYSLEKLKPKKQPALKHSISDVFETQLEELLLPETKEEAVNPEVIKGIPVSLAEKKVFRDALTLPPSKTALTDKIIVDFKYWYKDASSKIKIWEESLKEIEGYFGAGVVSYFLLLRWLLIMNFLIFLINFFCLTLPAIVMTDVHSHEMEVSLDDFPNSSVRAENFYAQNYSYKVLKNVNSVNSHGKNMSDHEKAHICREKYIEEVNLAKSYKSFWSHVQQFLEGTGWMEPTLLFLGEYPLETISSRGFEYNIPHAFIIVFIAIYVVCFIMIMNHHSFGIKEALMIQSDESHHFANDIFSAWDYCIRDKKNAALLHKSFTYSLKSSLSDIHFKNESSQRSHTAWIRLYATRLLVNLLVIGWIKACYFVIYKCVFFQLEEEELAYEGGFRALAFEYLPSVSVTAISSISPEVFAFLISYEKYPVRTEINFSILRNAFISLSSVFVLLASFQQQIMCEPRDFCGSGMAKCRSPRCWETYVGQELYKLIISEFIVFVGTFLLVTLPRHCMIERHSNKFTRLIGKTEFFLPTEVLNLIYLQTIVWLGVFYSPLLPAMMVIKFFLMFYIQKVQVMKYNVHLSTAYKASKFNSTYTILLILSFFVVLALHIYTLSDMAPSKGCSPFRQHKKMVDAFYQLLSKIELLEVWNAFFTAWFLVPAYAILCCSIYYYWKRIAVFRISKAKLNEELVLLANDRQYILEKIQELIKKGE